MQNEAKSNKIIFINDIEIVVFNLLINLRRKRDKRKMRRTTPPSNEEKLNLLKKLKSINTSQMRLVNQIYFNNTNDIIDIQILDISLFDTLNEVVDILLFINQERSYLS